MLDYISGQGQAIPPPAPLCFLEVRAGTSHQRVGTAALQLPKTPSIHLMKHTAIPLTM